MTEGQRFYGATTSAVHVAQPRKSLRNSGGFLRATWDVDAKRLYVLCVATYAQASRGAATPECFYVATLLFMLRFTLRPVLRGGAAKAEMSVYTRVYCIAKKR